MCVLGLAHLVRGVLTIAALALASGAIAETSSTAPRDTALTTILVVRHAEKDTLLLGSDPPLSGGGFKRARELARVLGDAGIQGIYVTEFLRNRQTALPLATALAESLRVLHGRDFAAQARLLRERHRGGTALVVGHSDTVPQLVEALSGTRVRDFRGGEWDPIYVVTLGPGGAARVFTFKYGDPAPGQ
jgi:broad specificity phosphatase PhoE